MLRLIRDLQHQIVLKDCKFCCFLVSLYIICHRYTAAGEHGFIHKTRCQFCTYTDQTTMMRITYLVPRQFFTLLFGEAMMRITYLVPRQFFMLLFGEGETESGESPLAVLFYRFPDFGSD